MKNKNLLGKVRGEGYDIKLPINLLHDYRGPKNIKKSKKHHGKTGAIESQTWRIFKVGGRGYS